MPGDTWHVICWRMNKDLADAGRSFWQEIYDRIDIELFAPTAASQLLVIALAFVVALVVRRLLAPKLAEITPAGRFAELTSAIKSLAVSLILPVTWWLGIILARVAAFQFRYAEHLLKTSAKLLTAWIIINIVLCIVRDRFWRRFLVVAIWTLAALDIVGLLQPAITLLDGAALKIGDKSISVWLVGKFVIALVILLQVVSLVSSFVERGINSSSELSPSLRLLLIQLSKILLFALTVLLTLEFIGVDLTAFAVFTGALGLGIGFGLQKVVSNLFSGLLLLVDRSIKPGDVISLPSGHGKVNKMGARFVSIVTPQGIEHLIPNEKFITEPVENWSYSDQYVMLSITIGVSYKSDLHKALEIIERVAGETERVVADPPPRARLLGYGDSSVDINALLWIADPQNGVYGPRHQFLLRLWDVFHEEGIEIPFPQRDVHLHTVPVPEGREE